MPPENVPEMGKFLRQTVDNSFEEGQFESAVSMLDLLRSPNHKPSIIHVLHLIFISIHSLGGTQLNEQEAELDSKTLLLQSPRKLINHAKHSMVLSGTAVIAAQQLLMSLLETNAPERFGEALPFYPETKNEPPMIFDFSESQIFKQAEAIKHSKNCWEVLKSSFYARSTHLLGTPKGKGKQASRLRFAEPAPLHTLDEDEIRVVGNNSWFLLEWLVSLFEKDSETRENEGQPRHSPLLLKQLPSPPIDSSTRFDASEPVKVVFYALQQDDSRRQDSGIRLMNLLIELTQASLLNLSSFASSVLAQLTTAPQTAVSPSSPHPPSPVLDLLSTLFAHLASTPSHLSFKLALCKKMLEDASSGESTSSRLGPTRGSATITHNAHDKARPTGIMKKPKPQPKAIPRPRPINPGVTIDLTTSDVAQEASSSGQPVSRTTSLATISPDAAPLLPPTYVAHLPSYNELTTLARTIFPFFTFSYPQNSNPNSRRTSLSTSRAGSPPTYLPSKPWATPSLILRVKFELLLAYVLVQTHRQELTASKAARAEPPDARFVNAVKTGEFAKVIDEVFVTHGADEETAMFRELIKVAVGLDVEEDNDAVMG